MMRASVMFGIGLTTVSGLARTADATWSILIADTRTGEVAVGSATCLTGFDLRAETPVILVGQAAATAQSLVDVTGRNRATIQDLFIAGAGPATILDELDAGDPSHQTRQYGIVNTRGGRATFSGDDASAWKGGVTGQVGSVVYAVQGNILTGAPVVEEARDALVDALNRGDDLAEALMVSMEAARAFGGDGRCSCDEGPEDCGSPPDPFDPDTTKTADVGYMLIARPGDIDVSLRRFQVGDRARGLAFADFDGDGRTDVAVAPTQLREVQVFRNTTRGNLPPGTGFADLADPLVLPGNERYNAAVAVDVNDDDRPDIVALGRDRTAEVFLNTGGFSFAPGPTATVIDDAFDAHLADVDPTRDGPELFVIGRSSRQAALYSTDAGVSRIGGLVFLPGRARHAAAGPDADPVFAVGSQDTDELLVYEGGPGGLSLAATLTTTAEPRGVVAADFNNDGTADVAAAGEDSGIINVFLGVPGSTPRAFTPTQVVTGVRMIHLAAADIDNDGDADLLAARGDFGGVTQDLALITNDGTGAFTFEGTRTASDAAVRLFAADLTGDNLPEILGVNNNGLTVATNRGSGPSVDPGFAGGEYYMELNEAFNSGADPDPVLLLRDQYDLWRAALAGVPDAVRSTIPPRPSVVPVNSGPNLNVFTVDITVRDLDLNPAVIDLADIRVTIDANRPQVAEFVNAAPTPNGIRLTLRTTGGFGAVPLNVTLDEAPAPGGTRTIELRPRPTLRVGLTAADIVTNGVLDLSDIDAFIDAYDAGSTLADINGDGEVDEDDIDEFRGAFAG